MERVHLTNISVFFVLKSIERFVRRPFFRRFAVTTVGRCRIIQNWKFNYFFLDNIWNYLCAIGPDFGEIILRQNGGCATFFECKVNQGKNGKAINPIKSLQNLETIGSFIFELCVTDFENMILRKTRLKFWVWALHRGTPTYSHAYNFVKLGRINLTLSGKIFKVLYFKKI